MTIAAAWNVARRKQLVPLIVDIAADIGANREALPIAGSPAETAAAK